MSIALRQFLVDVYIGHTESFPSRIRRDHPIQIDDQDDNDPIDGFCNIFVTAGRRTDFEIELIGAMQITPAVADLVEIYDGHIDRNGGRISLRLSVEKIDALSDLAERIRQTARSAGGNPRWDRIAARTQSSLRRFVRVIREFRRMHTPGHR